MNIKVWDLPLRIFHWLLVVAVVAAFVSVQIGGNAMVWHGRAGLAVIGLVVFRIVWGIIGPTYARFSQFVKGPAAIKAYLAGQWHGVGHNPLGALSVLALLVLLAAQASTGLFANDDIAYEGYLYPLITSALSNRLTGIHKLFEPLMMLLVVVHVGAIVYYARVKKHNLVKPMITGYQEATDKGQLDTQGGGIVALIIAITLAVGAVWMASGAFIPAAAPATSSTPAW